MRHNVIAKLLIISFVCVCMLSFIPRQHLEARTQAVKPAYSITSYDITMTFNIKDQSTEIWTEVEVKAASDIKSFLLFIDPVFTVKSITGLTNFTQDKDMIAIPIPIKKGASTKVKLYYVARLSDGKYPGRQWNYVSNQGINLFQWWYPVTLYTIAQGYSNIVSMKINATIDSTWKVSSTDISKEVVSKDKGTTDITIEARDPAYFYHFLAGPYVTGTIEDKKVVSKVTYFVEKANEPKAKEISAKIFDLMKFYEDTFGTPAPKNYTLTQMPSAFRNVLAEKALLLIPKNIMEKKPTEEKDLKKGEEKPLEITDIEFLTDKVAASWWGGSVYGIGPESEFLNTSLASYSGILYLGQKVSEAKMVEALRKARNKFFDKVKIEDEKPLTSSIKEDLLDIYFKNKGPLVFHMLRQVMGDAAFFKALKNFAGRFAGKFATIADFDEEISKAAGQKMTWFFEQWVNQVGRLTYKIDFQLLPGQKPFNYKVRLEPVGKIRMPFKIDVIMKDRSVETFQWELNNPEKERTFQSNKEPVGAKIHNPEGYIMTDESEVNSLLKGPISNFFYLGNFIIAEGTWQGNEVMEKAAKTRVNYYKEMLKKNYNLDVPVVKDKDLTEEDLKKYNLILVGCTGCNSILYFFYRQLPVDVVADGVKFGEGQIFGPEREMVFVAPNPSNPWSIVLADEFFASAGDYDTRNLTVDFFARSPKKGDVLKGFYSKFNTKAWSPPLTPRIEVEDVKTDKIEIFENMFTFKGESNVDFYITYNLGNRTVFGKPFDKVFVPKGKFDKKIALLRSADFVNETFTIESNQEFSSYKRILKMDFRGETEPPKLKIRPLKSSRIQLGTEVVFDWEATDNETFENDIKFAWRLDNGPLTNYDKAKRATHKNLKLGKHTFKLYAIDQRGNINYTTPTVQFEIVKK